MDQGITRKSLGSMYRLEKGMWNTGPLLANATRQIVQSSTIMWGGKGSVVFHWTNTLTPMISDHTPCALSC